jgi:flagellar FliJ protein
MRKYSFRLQRVLDIKEVIQDVKERELANSLMMLELEDNVLYGLKKKLNSYQNSIRSKKSLSVIEMRFYDNYFSWLFYEIERQLKRIEECKKEVEIRRRKLEEAFKEKRVIENLKQRSLEEYIREFDKEQQFHNDEVSVSKYFLPEELVSKISI